MEVNGGGDIERKKDEEGFKNQLTIESRMLAGWRVLVREFAT